MSHVPYFCVVEVHQVLHCENTNIKKKSESTLKASSGAQMIYFQLPESTFERMKIHLIGSSEKTIRALVIMSCII